MLTKVLLRRLKRSHGDRVFWMEWLAAQPLPLVGGAAVGLLMLLMVSAIALWPSSTPEPVAQSPVEPLALNASRFPAWEIAADALPGAVPLPTEPAQRHPNAPSVYEQSMNIGYRAYRNQDYHTALINFRRALAYKKGDYYATQAVSNVEAIIQYQQQQETH